MLHARADYNRIQDPAMLIPDDEPVFLLRAQDETAAETVRFWATLQKGGSAAELAFAQAERMQDWYFHKRADVPEDPLVETLELSARAYNCLRNAGIGNLSVLINTRAGDLKRRVNVGEKTIQEIRGLLAKRGLFLKGEGDGQPTAIPMESPSAAKSVEHLLKTISPREQEIISKRLGIGYGKPLTLRELALDQGISAERVRQIEAKAFRKLRHPSRLRVLRALFGDDLWPAPYTRLGEVLLGVVRPGSSDATDT